MFDYSEPDKSLYIQKRYLITNEEYDKLNKKYGKLCWFAASKLSSANQKSEEDLQDFHSEIVLGMFRAGSYYKRQKYIDRSFSFLNIKKIKISEKDSKILNFLQEKWKNKSSFLENHEKQLDRLILKYKSKDDENVPSRHDDLIFDRKFDIYCKAIIWNTYKSLGQHISKENSIKNHEVSLDEWTFLEGGEINSPRYEDSISYNPSLYQGDIKVVRKKLSSMEDKRPLKTFDILTNPDNFKQVFKKKQSKDKNNIKLNVVRKQTSMSYRTISNQIKIIKKVIKEELGY